MPLIELTNLDDARLRVFSSMTDSELRDPKQLVGLRLAAGSEVSDEGLFIAESRNVIDRAMDAGLAPFALLTDKRWALRAKNYLLASMLPPQPLPCSLARTNRFLSLPATSARVVRLRLFTDPPCLTLPPCLVMQRALPSWKM